MVRAHERETDGTRRGRRRGHRRQPDAARRLVRPDRRAAWPQRAGPRAHRWAHQSELQGDRARRGLRRAHLRPGSGALAIDRDNEYRNSVVAAASGVGAPVVEYLPEHSALVIGYIDGTPSVTMTSPARDGGTGGRGVPPPPLRRPVRQRLRHVRDPGRLSAARPRPGLPPAGRLPRIHRRRGADPGALAVRAEPTVACNNDLLAGNFIDDGDRIRLIDYEYAGNNDPCFELGNIWSECIWTTSSSSSWCPPTTEAPGEPGGPGPAAGPDVAVR